MPGIILVELAMTSPLLQTLLIKASGVGP